MLCIDHSTFPTLPNAWLLPPLPGVSWSPLAPFRPSASSPLLPSRSGPWPERNSEVLRQLVADYDVNRQHGLLLKSSLPQPSERRRGDRVTPSSAAETISTMSNDTIKWRSDWRYFKPQALHSKDSDGDAVERTVERNSFISQLEQDRVVKVRRTHRRLDRRRDHNTQHSTMDRRTNITTSTRIHLREGLTQPPSLFSLACF